MTEDLTVVVLSSSSSLLSAGLLGSDFLSTGLGDIISAPGAVGCSASFVDNTGAASMLVFELEAREGTGMTTCSTIVVGFPGMNVPTGVIFGGETLGGSDSPLYFSGPLIVVVAVEQLVVCVVVFVTVLSCGLDALFSWGTCFAGVLEDWEDDEGAGGGFL